MWTQPNTTYYWQDVLVYLNSDKPGFSYTKIWTFVTRSLLGSSVLLICHIVRAVSMDLISYVRSIFCSMARTVAIDQLELALVLALFTMPVICIPAPSKSWSLRRKCCSAVPICRICGQSMDLLNFKNSSWFISLLSFFLIFADLTVHFITVHDCDEITLHKVQCEWCTRAFQSHFGNKLGK